ncbi:hypothetical protein KP509_35G065800 [Ceratopteris richardii]|uniref:Beta-glucosidase n=1 Tax=Ceratopteris richardii TaxID=49495 RepID=A0A8T2QGB6_CERRI|nr:hypothetical protein KP509_35G065800 [Ceratopteris richardii]
MKSSVNARLPRFTEEESKELQGSLDFVGLNYYTAYYVQNASEELDPSLRWYESDRQATVGHVGPDGKLIGEAMVCMCVWDGVRECTGFFKFLNRRKKCHSIHLQGPPQIGWIFNCPWGLPKLLSWMENRYGKEEFQAHPIIITENGCMDRELNVSKRKALNDTRRINYLSGSLEHLANAIRNYGYNVQGFFAWSLIDNFEWESGLVCRFGLHYVDYDNKLKRYPKASAKWFKAFLAGK